MKRVAHKYGAFKELLKRFEGFVDTFQFLLSAIAVTLVIANTLVPSESVLPGGISWGQAVVWVRAFTWVVFIIDFVAYGLASGHPFKYARSHVLELVVCLTWVPYYDAAAINFRHLGSFLSVDMLTVIGSVVHIWMVGRWTVRRFKKYPHVVIIAATAVLIATATPILMKVEPQTFGSLSDALWFCIQTIFTVGYGDIVPKTDVGRIVADLLIVNGVGIGGMFIALMTRWMQHRLMESEDPIQVLTAKVDALIDENKATNALNRELLEELRKHRCGCDDASPPPSAPPT